MISIWAINDPHLSDGPPLGRQQGYGEQIFAKLEAIAAMMRDQPCDVLVITGDFWHRKRPDRTSHRLVRRLYQLLAALPVPVIGVAGNHDMTEMGLASLEKQPLGVLAQTGAVRLLMPDSGSTWIFEKDAKRVLFIGRPYDSERDIDPFYYALTEEEQTEAESADYVIMVVHGSILPKSGVKPYPHIGVHQIPLDEHGPVDLMLCGHIHDVLGMAEMPGGGTFINLGALSRITRTAENLNPKTPRNFVRIFIDEDGMQLEPTPIPGMLPPEKVFLPAELAGEDTDLAEFAEQLAASLVLEDQPIEEMLAALTGVPDNVKERLRAYLQAAGL
jgi:DNA repair exonuclease SbcCD nuclease subunit